MGQRVLMRMGVVIFGIALLAGGTAQASSFVTIEEPAPAASPSIVEVAPPAASTSATESVVFTSGSSVQLAALDPLNMLPAGSNSIVRMEPVTRSVVAVVAPDPNISNEIVAAIDHRKPRQDLMPMVMRGGIVGDAFQPEIELGKALKKLPAKADDKQVVQTKLPVDPEALSKPQVTETGAPMPANGMSGGGRPRHPALKPSMREMKSR